MRRLLLLAPAAAALLVSCGPSGAVCNGTTCSGCCAANGSCMPGSAATACGTGGSACVTCDIGSSCTAIGTCLAGTGTCGPATCSGCCDSTGSCQAGTAVAACGANGGACGPCSSSQTCRGGTCIAGPCSAANCSGCCNGNSCLLPTQQTDAGCGSSGVACAACPAGQSCQAGQCKTPGCSAANCQGCCGASGCVPFAQESTAQCGAAGASCAACPGGESCSAGACARADAGSSDAGGNGSDAGTPPDAGNPGDAGGSDAGPGVDAGNTQVGDPCVRAGDCAALGAGALCRLRTADGGFPYPGGYCTLDCSATACPGASQCVSAGGFYGETASLCWAPCADDFSCRLRSYACYSGLPDGGNLGCWINPPAPDGLIGSPCTTDPNCGPPPSSGFCTPAALPDGGPTGWTGGYCMADCTTAGSAVCGDGGTCAWQGGFSVCLEGCGVADGGQQNCRTGYACDLNPLPDGGFSPTGDCVPNPPPTQPSNLVVNGSFEADTNAPPFSWTMLLGSDAGVLVAEAGGASDPPPAQDGTNVAKFASLISSNFREARSNCFPISGGHPLTFTAYIRTPQAVANTKASLKVFYFDDASCTAPATPSYQTQISFNLQAPNVWQLDDYSRTASQVPADAGSAYVAVRAELASAGSAGTVYFDNVVVTQP